MTKETQKQRRDAKKQQQEYINNNPDSDDDIQNTKNMYETVYIRLQIVEEINDLYEKHFKINLDSPFGRGFSVFNQDEQIERDAQNMAFWETLYNEYEKGINAPIRNLRWQYLNRRCDNFRFNVYVFFINDSDMLDKIQHRANEIMRIT